MGKLSDSDFDFRGTTHSINTLSQVISVLSGGPTHRLGAIVFVFSPAMDDEDLESLMFTADGQQLTVANYSYTTHTSQITLEDPGFRWTAGQRIAVGLTTSQPVPVLPLAGAGLLAMLLGIGAYRRRRA